MVKINTGSTIDSGKCTCFFVVFIFTLGFLSAILKDTLPEDIEVWGKPYDLIYVVYTFASALILTISGIIRDQLIKKNNRKTRRYGKKKSIKKKKRKKRLRFK